MKGYFILRIISYGLFLLRLNFEYVYNDFELSMTSSINLEYNLYSFETGRPM